MLLFDNAGNFVGKYIGWVIKEISIYSENTSHPTDMAAFRRLLGTPSVSLLSFIFTDQI